MGLSLRWNQNRPTGYPQRPPGAFLKAELPKNRTFEWVSYQYRYYNQEAGREFGKWLAGKDWADVVQATGSKREDELYQEEVMGAMERCFSLITDRINNRIRRQIKKRKGIYRKEGRSDILIKNRRATHLESQKECILVKDATRNYFRNVKAFKTKDRPKAFDPMSLFPGKNEAEVAHELASFFNRISAEFEPLEPSDIPRTHSRTLPVLLPYQVEGRIRAFKKPKSMVRGDIIPVLFNKFATLLVFPLTEIYNKITASHIWPFIWKKEYVTIIPKCRNPEGLGDLRNISCTLLPSKIYESFVLNWLSTEVSCKKNQYGGVKGCSLGHLLVDMWDEVLTSLEDARAAIMVTAIDYAKTFNRLSFQHCLAAFVRKGGKLRNHPVSCHLLVEQSHVGQGKLDLVRALASLWLCPAGVDPGRSSVQRVN